MKEQTTYEEKKQIIIDYYSTKDRYIYRKEYSTPQLEVYTKENNKYLWLTLERKSSTQIEVRQIDHDGRIITADSYELTGNIPKCTGSDRKAVIQKILRRIEAVKYEFVHFNEENLNIICQYGKSSKEETCRNMSEILQTINDSGTMNIVGETLGKIKLLSAESCKGLTAVIKRWKESQKTDNMDKSEIEYSVMDAGRRRGR